MKKVIPVALVTLSSLVITLLGVIFFFKPVEASDTSILSLPPYFGLAYIFLCVAIYLWAHKQLGNCYKAALVVTLPQVALIIDLMIRGDRGMTTTVAGSLLLFVTWFVTAFAHNSYLNAAASGGDHKN